MLDNSVGAGILSIITESLYDNPIVVFREYVQNSVDSIFSQEQNKLYEIKIWTSGRDLFFLDNAKGIAEDNFQKEMIKIGDSNKRKQKNLGYKGIGRLSGVPYCDKLYFVNILSYSDKKAQLYIIDNLLYVKIKNELQESNMCFSELMDKIGKYSDDINSNEWIFDELEKYSDVLSKTNTGFFVVMKNISQVLETMINSDDFEKKLQWLLPVDFNDELYTSDKKELFQELTKSEPDRLAPIRFCDIFFNDKKILRPITTAMFRHYVCKNNFKYAVGFHTFNSDKLVIDKQDFTGIHVYVDNMLLCTEEELLRSLDSYGLLSHTYNGQVQSVRCIGAMIYITDKVNISANARRTFIEVTDNDSLEFLKLLAEFVNTIYDTRYALSNYASAKNKQDKNSQKLSELRREAIENLRKLAKEDVELPEETEVEFEALSSTEKKRMVKKKIVSYCDGKIKAFINEINSYNLDSVIDEFRKWIQKN